MTDEASPPAAHEQLSALVDGELPPDQRRFLLRRLPGEPELAARWERWHIARACLRGQGVAPVAADFAARVSAALATEAAPARHAGGRVLRWAGGFAVAASVAMAALLALPGPSELQPEPAAPPAIAASQVTPSGVSERDLRPNLGTVAQTVAAGGQPLAPALRLDPRVETYLMRHNAVLLQDGQDSFLPFIHVVSPPRQWSMLPPAAAEADDAQ